MMGGKGIYASTFVARCIVLYLVRTPDVCDIAWTLVTTFM